MIVCADYIRRINDKYESARAEYNKLWTQYDSKNAARNTLRANRNKYTPSGYNENYDAITGEMNGIIDKLKGISAGFKSDAAAIRSECEEKFRNKYGIKADKVDNSLVILLNSGALSPAELRNLGNDYGDNATMLRLIGAKLKEIDDAQAQAFGDEMIERSKQQPHLDLIDRLAYAGNMSLRIDEGDGRTPEENRNMNEGVAAEVYPGVYNNTLTAAREITTE